MSFCKKLLLQSFVVLLFSCFGNTVVHNNCNFNVKVKQILLNNGFHRNITYSIVFYTEDEREQWLYKDCILGLEQVLPPGVFANPDELSDLRRTHRLNAVPKNKINVELPAEDSSASVVYVIGKVMDSKVHLWLPVHARYHRAVSGGGKVRNEIGPPKLYLRCPDERLDMCNKTVSPAATFLCNGSSKDTCSWKEVPYIMLTDTLLWNVPVGNLDHYYIVTLGTVTVLIAGSMYILNALHEYAVAARKKKHY